MAAPVDLSLSLTRRPRASTAEDLASRLRLVLETQPGRLPYDMRFGCDLDGLVGHAATRSHLTEVRMRVASALRAYLPEVEVASCTVRVAERAEPGSASHPSVPLAERAIASAGLSAVVEVRVVLETEDGPITLDAQLSP